MPRVDRISVAIGLLLPVSNVLPGASAIWHTADKPIYPAPT
jgi:hypothetical protein